jgi:hypothetical protein
MSGALWFGVVVLVSVVVSGSMGIILKAILADSKDSVRNEGIEKSRDEKNEAVKGENRGNSGTIIFDGGVVSAEYFRGYLDGHRDGSGRNDDALGMVALQQRCRDGYYSR